MPWTLKPFLSQRFMVNISHGGKHDGLEKQDANLLRRTHSIVERGLEKVGKIQKR